MKTMRLSDKEAQLILDRRAEQHHKRQLLLFKSGRFK